MRILLISHSYTDPGYWDKLDALVACYAEASNEFDAEMPNVLKHVANG